MDWVTIRKEGKEYFHKYKFLLLILALGIFLMNFPGKAEKTEPEQPQITAESPDLEQRIQEILSTIQGVGEVRVLLTESSGEEYRYQMDEQMGTEGNVTRKETVIVRDESRQAVWKGLYPTGEGAGYAGGIMSAAIDGIQSAESLIASLTE